MNSNKDYNEAMENIAVRLRDYICNEIARKGLYDTGELYKSIDYELSENNILILANYYLPYAEFGRGPGKVPYGFENIIADWAKRKGIAVKNNDFQKFGEAVKWKTKKYGSARHRGDIPEADVLSQPVDDIMNDTMMEEFAGVLTAKVMEGLDDLLQ